MVLLLGLLTKIKCTRGHLNCSALGPRSFTYDASLGMGNFQTPRPVGLGLACRILAQLKIYGSWIFVDNWIWNSIGY